MQRGGFPVRGGSGLPHLLGSPGPSTGPSTGLHVPRASEQAAEEPGAREASKDPEARKQNSSTESPGAVAKVVSVS